MNKNVIISVKGIQTSSGKDTNTLELVTEGRYYKKGNTYYVTYKESEVTGMDGTTTTLKIANGIVTLMRFGSVNTQFIFEKGQKHVSYYDTQYGTFTVGVMTNAVTVDVDDEGGEIRVDYHLEIDNNKQGGNDFHMFIREAGQVNDECSGSIEVSN
ncbi:MAG: putative beta-barrel protein YwiB [Firmicutes bacterium ADurb.Bin419]|nr:MAG: putative beta-barrel protein YwiB [Firmicutes bacterium ADurb.Bin419]